jgi:hypothetical protein
MSRKTYFRMPNFDYPPNGLVQLGQIITSPRDPYQRLAKPLPIPDQAIQTNTFTDYHEVIERVRKGNLGVWVQFLASMLGVGGDATARWATKNSHILQFRELEANCFEPENDYLQESVLSSETIQTHIKKTPGKSLYMVTGVKIARGARSVLQEKQARGVNARFGVDATGFTGVPAQGGPQFKVEATHHEKVQFGGSKDFVFAYRLLRIIPKPHGVIKKKRFEAGATTLTNDDAYIEDADQAEDGELESEGQVVELTTVELDRSDYGSTPDTLPFKVDTQDAVEDELGDTDCVFIIPKTDGS